MTQAAHTPGPWKVSKPTGNYIDAPTGGSIAALTYGATKADADLIAAAPDLLAVLEGMDEELSLWGADTIETMNLTARLDAIRAAITKAKGE